MMSLNVAPPPMLSTPLSAPLPAPLPAPTPADAPHAPQPADHPCARLLRQSRDDAAASTPPAGPTAAEASAGSAAATSDATSDRAGAESTSNSDDAADAAGGDAAAQKSRARAPRLPAGPAPKAGLPATAAETPLPAEHRGADAPKADAVAADDRMAQWLAQLGLRPEAVGADKPAAKAGGKTTDAGEPAARKSALDPKALAASAGDRARVDTAAPADAAAQAASTHAVSVDDAVKLAAAGVEASTFQSDLESALAKTTSVATADSSHAFQPRLQAIADAPPPVAISVPTPVDTADFAPALAMQVSVLARDGISHAELHLNPADMGPVSVQISVDGTRAHVEFGADLAATRSAIEAGLPELAGALRDAGFTLAGGGVSQHSRERNPAQPSALAGRSGRSSDDDDGAPTVAVPLRRSIALGGVDLYA